MEACSGRVRCQPQIELEAAASDAGLAWCSRRRSIHRTSAEAERTLGWLRDQLAAAAKVSVRSRRNAGAAIGLHEIEDQERHRVRIDRRWARARAAASITSVPW